MRRILVILGAVAAIFGLSGFAVSASALAGEVLVPLSYTWSGESPDQTDVDVLDWQGAPGSDFANLDECDSGLFGSCDYFTGAGPIVTADGSGTYTPGDIAGWHFKPGGPDTYMTHVQASGVNVTGPDELSLETQGPAAFIGLSDGTDLIGGTTAVETEPLEFDDDVDPEVKEVVFGMADTGDPFVEDHWAGLGSLTVKVGDDVNPSGTYDVPTGWMDENVDSIPVQAEDNGVGLYAVFMGGLKRNPAHILDFYIRPTIICQDFLDAATEEVPMTELCPLETSNTFTVPFTPSHLREGYSDLSFTVADIALNSEDTLDIPIKIDTQDPTSTLGGSFTTAPGMVLDGALYELEVDAADGNPTGVQNSGVKKIQVLVDDVEIDSDTQSCPGDNCTMELDTDIEPDNWSNGEHQLKVKVTDQVGHVKTTTVDFEVDR